jgi:DNA-binding helix-hairpin-helix protein with protein kinase domain
MNMIVTGLQGAQYNLDSKRLSDGGEGEIFRVLGGSNRVAKIYKPGVPSKELEEKLKFMMGNQPSATVLNQVAWPLDIIYHVNHLFCGFVMPELKINAELGDIYKYPSQSNISTKYKIIIAQNICAVISEVHKIGYVFGDFNPRNIAIDIHNGHVAFLDTDSYHVVINQNRVYRCNVCAPGYSAPELLEKCSNHVQAHPGDSKIAYAKTPLPTFTRETDNFALAIHNFKLLMNGYTP